MNNFCIVTGQCVTAELTSNESMTLSHITQITCFLWCIWYCYGTFVNI